MSDLVVVQSATPTKDRAVVDREAATKVWEPRDFLVLGPASGVNGPNGPMTVDEAADAELLASAPAPAGAPDATVDPPPVIDLTDPEDNEPSDPDGYFAADKSEED